MSRLNLNDLIYSVLYVSHDQMSLFKKRKNGTTKKRYYHDLNNKLLLHSYFCKVTIVVHRVESLV